MPEWLDRDITLLVLSILASALHLLMIAFPFERQSKHNRGE